MKLTSILIAVEGIDGSGKSTQIARMDEWFKNKGCKTCITAEPTKGPFGRQIREAPSRLPPILERDLFIKDRKEHLETCIKPALNRGEIVITDRYFYSSVAYQGARRDFFNHAPSDDELWALQDEIYQQNREIAPEPDILIWMKLDPDEAMRRMKTGRDTLDPFEARQNLIDVAQAYERIAQAHPNVMIIDASKSPDEVTHQIFAALENIFHTA